MLSVAAVVHCCCSRMTCGKGVNVLPCGCVQVNPPLSAHAKDFIKVCLRHRPSARPTIKQLLQHDWIVAHRAGAGAAAPPLGDVSAELVGAEDGAWSDVLEAVDCDTARRMREAQR